MTERKGVATTEKTGRDPSAPRTDVPTSRSGQPFRHRVASRMQKTACPHQRIPPGTHRGFRHSKEEQDAQAPPDRAHRVHFCCSIRFRRRCWRQQYQLIPARATSHLDKRNQSAARACQELRWLATAASRCGCRLSRPRSRPREARRRGRTAPLTWWPCTMSAGQPRALLPSVWRAANQSGIMLMQLRSAARLHKRHKRHRQHKQHRQHRRHKQHKLHKQQQASTSSTSCTSCTSCTEQRARRHKLPTSQGQGATGSNGRRHTGVVKWRQRGRCLVLPPHVRVG